jgi:hypothetical protein
LASAGAKRTSGVMNAYSLERKAYEGIAEN